jgi:hypothetical protein
VGGGEGVMTCAEIAMHLANHTTYQRGYVAGMLYRVPANPPTTDLTVFIRDVPEPRLIKASASVVRRASRDSLRACQATQSGPRLSRNCGFATALL